MAERLDGLAESRPKNDVFFFARYAKQKIDRLVEAKNNIAVGIEHKSDPDMMLRLEREERHSRFMLLGALEYLKNSLLAESSAEATA